MFCRIILPLLLSVIVLLLTSGSPSTPAWEKENVSFPMMNQEIRHTMQENERQTDMHKKQITNLGIEKLNKREWLNFKETTQKIQDRLRFVDFALQAIPTGYVITLEAERIADMQSKLLAEIQSAPYALMVLLPSQLNFLNDTQMVIRLLVGIVASYGAINQMEKAERKILLDFALGEIKQLTRDAHFMLRKVKQIKQKWRFTKFLFKNYVNKDKQIIRDIMSNF